MSLFANLGKGDFKALRKFALSQNEITQHGLSHLLSAIQSGGLPELSKGVDPSSQYRFWHTVVDGNSASEEVINRVLEAVKARCS